MELNRYSICANMSDIPLLSIYNSYHGIAHRSYVPHFHTSFELALFKEGTGRYRCNNKLLSFSQGDIFMFSTNEEHFIEQITEEMTVLNVHFEFQYILSCTRDEQRFSFMDVFFNRREDFCNKIDRNLQIAKEISRLMLSMEAEMREQKANYEIIVQSKLLTVLSLLSREFGSTQGSFKIPHHLDKMRELEMVINYINAHYTEQLTLDMLSKVGKMDISSLCKLFKKTHGITIWDYITIRRIDSAKNLLKNTDKKILDIQFLCGYQTCANFNKNFKKLTNMSPREYRNLF